MIRFFKNQLTKSLDCDLKIFESESFDSNIFWGGGVSGGEVVGVILFIPRTVSKHKRQLLPCKVCAILYLSKERVANPHPRM